MFLKISQITQEIPVLESLLNKVADFHTCSFIKKELQHRCFPVKIGKFFFMNTCFYRIPPVADFRPSTLLKRDSTQVFFCEICGIFIKAFLDRTPPVTASNVFFKAAFS